jgi:UDP-sugar transporter A1/2/3
MILRRTIGPKRWLALLILTLGVSVVCLPHEDAPSTTNMFHHSSDHFFPRSVNELGQSAAKRAARVAQHLTKRAFGEPLNNDPVKRTTTFPELHEEIPSASENNYTVGLVAALVAAASSGLAGVYFEKMLKESATVSIWTRNVQLSFYSLFPALFLGVFVKDGAEMREHGFFDGYNWVVWVAIVLQAMGGVLSSLCINYADNIAKNFASSISIVVSFVFSVLFFHFVFGPTVGLEFPLCRL